VRVPFHRPFRTGAIPPRYQTLRIWLISGCAFGTSARNRFAMKNALPVKNVKEPEKRWFFGILGLFSSKNGVSRRFGGFSR
jgi:hypothetical protein